MRGLFHLGLRCHEKTPARSDIAGWPSPRGTRPRRTYFLSSQMNAIGEFSAPLNGFRPGYPSNRSCQMLEIGLI